MIKYLYVLPLFILLACSGSQKDKSVQQAVVPQPQFSSTPTETQEEVVTNEAATTSPTVDEVLEKEVPKVEIAKTTSTLEKGKAMAEKVETQTKTIVKETEEVTQQIEKVVVDKVKNGNETVVEKVKSLDKNSVSKKTGETQKVQPETKDPKPVSKSQDKRQNTDLHQGFDQLLRKHVSANGQVDYKGIKQNAAQLDAYLSELESAHLSSLNTKQKLVFWMNAYNAYTIKLILNNYPVASITDLHGGKPWDVKWIKLNGQTLSLNNIENDIIRPEFNEPRIHFAVNCAAKSCPPILNRAWKVETLARDLKSQTEAFINNTSHNEISKSSITISKIFEWYAKDFGDLIGFINKYSEVEIDPNATINYKEYNWKLNN